MSNKRIIIGGGGTGGHVFPAISIADALRQNDPSVEILFVGAEKKLEMEKVPEAGYQIKGLPVTGFQRRLSYKNLVFIINLLRSILKSKQIINQFKPHAAVGVGGYASGPILRAASKSGVPVMIQEQNSYAGITNRLLAKSAVKIFVAYDHMDNYFPSEKIILTGNPIRKDIIDCYLKRNEAVKFFGLDPRKKTLLVIGGSLGARTVNESILSGLPRLKEDIQLIWQTGKTYFNRIENSVISSLPENIKILPFIVRMDLAFSLSDLIISRAGAGIISELAVAGKPVILVPSPNVAEDHQTKNALALVEKDAAIYIPDSEVKNILVEEALKIMEDEKLKNKLSENIKKLAIPDAANRIANEILKLI